MKYLSPLFFIVLFACKNFITSNPKPINEMKVIMWDMYCADELFTEKQIKDSSLYKKPRERFKLYDQVFAIHKISRENFYSNYQYYVEHTDQFKILMDSIQAYGLLQRNKPIMNKLQSMVPN